MKFGRAGLLTRALILLGTWTTKAAGHMIMTVPASRSVRDAQLGTAPVSAVCGGYPKGRNVGRFQAGGFVDVEISGSASHNGGGCMFSLVRRLNTKTCTKALTLL